MRIIEYGLVKREMEFRGKKPFYQKFKGDYALIVYYFILKQAIIKRQDRN